MKIIDKTPYRTETGEIDILGRIQGTLKYGLTWYNRIQAQDTVIAIMGKQLNDSYTLLRNLTLPDTEINLPLILVGPPGVFLVNVTHEHGVYQAKDDEWGSMVGDRFVPAGINQIGRTLTFGRVLQRYLDVQGLKGMVVESILMAADPGMHIESTRPAVRIVMSDALERFAASLAQARVILNAPAINDIVQIIMVGRQQRSAPQPDAAPSPSPYALAEREASSFETYSPGQPESQSGEFSSESMAFSFNDEQPAGQAASASTQKPAPTAKSAPGQSARPKTAARPAARKRSKNKGLTSQQWMILAALVFFWLCLMAGAIVYFVNA